jgi:thiamine monophosphate synthase
MEGDGGLPAEDERHDLVQWWAEIFEPPVVAMGVATAEAARELAGVGADFVAIGVPDGLAPEAAARWLAPFLNALASARAVAWPCAEE